MRTTSLSLASETLDVPQPTLSRYLKQLRDHFGNQLFVRTRTGLEPTSIAISSAPAVSQALEPYRTRLSGEPSSDPLTSDRDFHIATSHVGQPLGLPRLPDRERAMAPNVRSTAEPRDCQQLYPTRRTGQGQGRHGHL